MRAIGWAVLLLGFAACKYPELPKLTGDAALDDSNPQLDASGDDAAIVDAGTDATLDAAHACSVPADLSTLTLGMPGMEAEANFFAMASTGPNAGKTIFTLAGALGQNPPVTVLDIEVVKPVGGYAVNTAYAFSSNADPNFAYSARSFLYGNYDSGSNTHDQYLYASSGSITFTAIGEAPASMITGTVTVTSYREVDETTGVDVPGGCTSTLQGMQFALRQMP